jgi:Dolichyl-phosphate-mannose-protein mannosyltransferase
MNVFTRPASWIGSPRSIAARLFLTCWLVYSLHVATNTVREIYLALAIGDHLSFRVDEYAHIHPDLFEKPGYGWHIGANPGASMLGAIPYAAGRPVLDRVVAAVNRSRAHIKEAPVYNSPWPMARRFFEESWRRGYDVKFGLAAILMQVFCMAPISAISAVAMFHLLRRLFGSDRTGFWLALLYAFGTPVFFRTGYLNHNLMLGQFAFLGFLAMWNPGQSERPEWQRYLLGGLSGGAALLLDYSGLVFLLGLFGYAVANAGSARRAVRLGAWYVAGSVPPVLLLWWYQWRSFGNPFLPGQHWMPPVAWIENGYQGFTLPQLNLLTPLLFDYRYGLFVTCPLFLLALLAPFANSGLRRVVPRLEFLVFLGLPLGLWLFCGGISYTRLQYNTGLRYLAPLLPFLFVPAAVVLERMSRRARYFVAVAAITEAWCMAMSRDVERGLGVLDPILRVLTGGFQLPVLTVVSRMTQFAEYTGSGVSPLPVFAVAAAALYGIWGFGRAPGRPAPEAESVRVATAARR